MDPFVIVGDAPPILVEHNEAEEGARRIYQNIKEGDAIFGGRDVGGQTSMQLLCDQKDESGRALWEVLRDVVRTVTAGVSITRVDLFVKFGSEGHVPKVHLNEVEHGFQTTFLAGQFSMKTTELISKAWLLTAATAEERERFSAMRGAGAP